MSPSRDTSKSTSSNPPESVSLRAEGITSGPSDDFYEAKERLESENSRLKNHVGVLRLFLILSWLIFFNILAFSNLPGLGAVVIAVFQVIGILVYMNHAGDNHLPLAIDYIRRFLGGVRGKDAPLDPDESGPPNR